MDDGMIGSICINGIIEQLAMHQMAFVESRFIMPEALFINKKFRHPFRIYANNAGSICASICEVPVMLRGVTFLVDAILDWTSNMNCNQVIVIGGISPSSFTPSLKERKALLLRNMPSGGETNSWARANPSIPNQIPINCESSSMYVPDSAILPGVHGAILSACAARNLQCTALMIPTLGYAPDPEGGAIALESLKEIIPSLSIDTTQLRMQAELGRPGSDQIYK